ncbi:hypothetical protein [Streptomyces sp. NPDC059533]|uniref:hypothetical protein n=1 Tax=unclassified Streptomyces TaxID=2593676 RepID=UPI00367E118A
MVIALLVFVLVGAFLAVTPGVVVGFVVVVTTRRLSLRVRVPVLLLVAAATAALWLGVIESANLWRSTAIGLTFLSTLASGAGFLGIEAAKRRARRIFHPQWPGWYPPAANR